MSLKENLLNKSDTYNFLKNENQELIAKNDILAKENEELMKNYENLIVQNNKIIEENKKLIDSFNKLNDSFERYQLEIQDTKHEIFSRFDRLYDRDNTIIDNSALMDRKNKFLTSEIQYALVFNDTIRESEWLDKKNFSLINSAANYSFAYSLYRILNDARPENILELGLGQSTKMTSQYVNHFDKRLHVIEGDQDWIDIFSDNLDITDNIDITHKDLETIVIEDTFSVRYKDVLDGIEDEKFDLIIIDGPQGYIMTEEGVKKLDYSRTNVWELLENNLADDFIIIIDDYERYGEKRTMDHVKKVLTSKNIKYHMYSSEGLKSQYAVFSEKFRFISWI